MLLKDAALLFTDYSHLCRDAPDLFEAGPPCMILYPQARFARLGLRASLRDAPDLFEAGPACMILYPQARFARLGLRASLRDAHDLFEAVAA